jgi:hypothetical protein
MLAAETWMSIVASLASLLASVATLVVLFYRKNREDGRL